MTGLVPRQVASAIPSGLSEAEESADIPALASWLMSEEAHRDPGVRQWISFLASFYAQFRIISELYPRVNPGRKGLKDDMTVATSPEELLAMANHLFILRSHGVKGSVLECGCFKGYSSCCLSLVCRRLNFPMIIADSFAGLPPDPAEVGEHLYYQVGDFAGSRAEVEQNLRTYGDPAAVELLQGWFSDTLKGWNRPLAMVWLDVDLWSSVMDVLNPCLPHLDPLGAIFSHEFTDASQLRDSKIVDLGGPAGAIAKIIGEHDPEYRAAHVCGNLGFIGRRCSVGLQSYRLVNALVPALSKIGMPWIPAPAPPPVPSHLGPVYRSHLSRASRKVARIVGIAAKHEHV
jgi:hypothetical protein